MEEFKRVHGGFQLKGLTDNIFTSILFYSNIKSAGNCIFYVVCVNTSRTYEAAKLYIICIYIFSLI